MDLYSDNFLTQRRSLRGIGIGSMIGDEDSGPGRPVGQRTGRHALNSHLVVAGFQPVNGIPREDYQDFLGAVINSEEIKYGLSLGVFPPGLILQSKKSGAYVVFGNYDTVQRLEPYLREVKIT